MNLYEQAKEKGIPIDPNVFHELEVHEEDNGENESIPEDVTLENE